MVIRQDKRTPPPPVKKIRDFPIVESYNYLGIIIDDSLKLDLCIDQKKLAMNKLKKNSKS